MALQLPHRTLLRRAATTAALGAAMLAPLASPAAAAKKAKRSQHPVVTSVAPMQLTVGDTLEVRGRNFLPGKERNTVVFQRAGGKAVFVKARLGTRKLLKVDLPEKLHKALTQADGGLVPTRLNIRVLSARFGKRFTRDAGSPVVTPKPPAPAAVSNPVGPSATSDATAPPAPSAPAPAPVPFDQAGPDGDCDVDKIPNGAEADDDADLIPDEDEKRINKRLDDAGLPGGRMQTCAADSDGDGIPDGYEYRAARDLNDDEYQNPNAYLPAPEKRMYPNPLDSADLNKDYDGDWLTLWQEYRLHRLVQRADKVDVSTLTLDTPLAYSDGMQYSVFKRDGRNVRRPALAAAGYTKAEDFINWARTSGNDPISIPGVDEPVRLFDFNRDGVLRSTLDPRFNATETLNFDDGDGWLSDDERDEDADGLNNFEETSGRMDADWWSKRYPRENVYVNTYAGTDVADADTDGDGVRDGADDQDFDDIPNLMELSRNMATGLPYDDPKAEPTATLAGVRPRFGWVNPFNPCLPDVTSRTCPRYIPFDNPWAPFDAPDKYPVYMVLN